MRRLLRRLRYLRHQRRAHEELSEELEFHREMAEADLRDAGTPPENLDQLAHLQLGSASVPHDEMHDVWVPRAWQGLGQDVRLAIRTLASTPLVSTVCLLSLALGIGATTAIFSVTNAVLLRQPAVEDPGRLALVVDDTNRPHPYWQGPVWREIESRPYLFASALAWSSVRFDLAPGGETDYVDGIRVSGSYFRALGVTALVGRTITADDDVRGGGPDGPVAMISYDFWLHRFGGASTAIGTPITLDRVAYTIVGVLPRAFHGLDAGRPFAVVAPLRATASAGTPLPPVRIVGRLRPGETLTTATTALRAAQPEIRAATLPSGWPAAFLERYLQSPFSLESVGQASSLRQQFSRPLLTIMAVVSLVLLVACANLANLGGARAAARRRELGLRSALGASRLRLVRQLTAESVVLAAASAGLGLLVARWSARLLVQQLAMRVGVDGPQPGTGAVFLDLSIDSHVLAFTIAVTTFTVLVVGLLPALRASRVDPLDALLERPSGWRRRSRVVGHGFLALQVGLSVVVVIAAGLFGRTLASLASRPLGFETDGIVVATLDASGDTAPPTGLQARYADLLERVRHEPDVAHAALSSIPPVRNGPKIGQPIQAISGEPPLPPRGANVGLNLVSPGWFETLGIPLVQGRDVGDGDGAGAPPVVVVNQAFVRAFVHGDGPIGRTVTLFLPGSPPPPVTIVGVVADTVYGSLRDRIEPTLYLPIAQLGPVWTGFLTPMSLSVRTRGGFPPHLRAALAGAVTATNPDLSVTFHTLGDYIDDSLVQERLTARLSSGFAFVAVLLAALGLYGVAAFAVAGRRTELGIRIALGATPRHVARLVIGLIARPALVGLVGGVAVSWWLTRLVASLLYEVTTRDPVTFVMAAGLLVCVTLVACWVPARRAGRIAPASVVRCS
jgi:putative ABC transport system permease protein